MQKLPRIIITMTPVLLPLFLLRSKPQMSKKEDDEGKDKYKPDEDAEKRILEKEDKRKKKTS